MLSMITGKVGMAQRSQLVTFSIFVYVFVPASQNELEGYSFFLFLNVKGQFK